MDKSKARSILIITCIGFFSFGLLWAAIGPLLAQFADRNGTNLATIGGIYSTVFLGAVSAQIILGPLTDRWGQLRTLTFSLLTLALGIAGVSFSTWLPLTFFLAFLAGLGQGLTNLSGNVMIGQIYKEKSVSAVNLINVFFGIGAFIGPLLVSAALHLWKNGFPALWFSTLLMAVVAMIFLLGYFNEPVGAQNQSDTQTKEKRIHISPFLWSLGAMLLLYVGAESAMGGWATTYMLKTTALNIEIAALVASGFWLAITLGRISGTLLGSHLSAKRILTLCLLVLSFGTILFLVSYGQTALSIVAIFLIGLGMGAIYPTGMAMMTSTYPNNAGKAASLITAMGAVGGMVLPWLQGVVMENASIRAGTITFAIFIVLMVISFGVNQKLSKQI